MQPFDAPRHLRADVADTPGGVGPAAGGQLQYPVGVRVDQPVLKRQESLCQAELALTPAPAAKLKLHAPGVVNLCADDAQAQGELQPANLTAFPDAERSDAQPVIQPVRNVELPRASQLKPQHFGLLLRRVDYVNHPRLPD